MADADGVIVQKVKKKRNRPSILPEEEKKRRRKEIELKRSKGRISIGFAVDRWREMKAKLRVKSDEKLAITLMDRRVTYLHISFLYI
ncbi:hypothetical protein FSP39_015284 [Pinctada imbricata]|uniref:Uncharacterized protein n=1 Tax=Pinctada imbricata TaxID=66713 RepID=A0AA88XFR1_PINIB|nr:hypothetical protein FSP39_015284 [Pinctada imbricata]